jgi:hypothetical protein
MSKTTVVNIKNDKYDVYIGRWRKYGCFHGYNGYFGNPFPITESCDREQCIAKFRDYFYKRITTDKVFAQKVKQLKGKVLGCFCKPQACHGDIIAEFLNGSKS